MAATDLVHAIEESHEALRAIVNGDPEPFRRLFSTRSDITLGNPFGPFAVGPDNVATTLAGAAAHYGMAGT